MQCLQWERGATPDTVGGEATWPNVASSRHSGRRSTMWREHKATALLFFL